jgi:hypothetical protein
MHRPLFVITAGSVAACGALIIASALPAAAATSVRAETAAPAAATPVTFSVTTTGVLAITAPTGTVDLGSGTAHNAGASIGTAGNFGSVTVADDRGLNPADWTATVSSTDFTNSVTPADIIPATAATYIAGAITADTASTLPLSPGITDNTLPAGIGLTDAAQPVVTEIGADGDNAATWDPEIAVLLPVGAVVGIYDGTVTHSVT